MPLSVQDSSDASVNRYPPDARQTRIDFFRSGRQSNTGTHILTSKKASFDWWHSLTGWLRSSKHEQEHHYEDYRNFLISRKYSEKTCRSYLYMLRKFFAYLDKKEVDEITLGEIEDYNYDFFVSGKYSRPYQLQFINAITLYLEFAQGVKVKLKGLRRSEIRR